LNGIKRFKKAWFEEAGKVLCGGEMRMSYNSSSTATFDHDVKVIDQYLRPKIVAGVQA